MARACTIRRSCRRRRRSERWPGPCWPGMWRPARSCCRAPLPRPTGTPPTASGSRGMMSAAALVDEGTGLGWAPLNQFDQELRPMEICSRQVLARVADSAAAAGTSYRMSFETEFTLFRPDGQGGWTFAHEGPGYGLRALIDTDAFAAELLAAMEEVGLGTELLHPEYTAGQMEVSVAPAAPVAAADRLVLTRLLIARTARRHG